MRKFFKKKSTTENSKTEAEIIFDKNNIPLHIGIIMDGNGRWATIRNLPRTFGHKAAMKVIRPIVEECSKLGVKYLTLYAFSTENWKRPAEEINTLMNLFVEYIDKEIDDLDKNNVIFNVIGKTEVLPEKCKERITMAKERTKNNTGLTLNIAINYGGRDEIVEAVKTISEKVKNNEISIEDINEKLFEENLYTAGMPDVDIIIRSSGELRISNFMLWQGAYSEIWIDKVFWPDFSVKDLHRAIRDYQNRSRRFGGV